MIGQLNSMLMAVIASLAPPRLVQVQDFRAGLAAAPSMQVVDGIDLLDSCLFVLVFLDERKRKQIE